MVDACLIVHDGHSVLETLFILQSQVLQSSPHVLTVQTVVFTWCQLFILKLWLIISNSTKSFTNLWYWRELVASGTTNIKTIYWAISIIVVMTITRIFIILLNTVQDELAGDGVHLAVVAVHDVALEPLEIWWECESRCSWDLHLWIILHLTR